MSAMKQPDEVMAGISLISLKQIDPVCFAYLSPYSIMAPLEIHQVYFDFTSADYFNDRASVWVTLQAKSKNYARDVPLLECNPLFLKELAHAFTLAATR